MCNLVTFSKLKICQMFTFIKIHFWVWKAVKRALWDLQSSGFQDMQSGGKIAPNSLPWWLWRYFDNNLMTTQLSLIINEDGFTENSSVHGSEEMSPNNVLNEVFRFINSVEEIQRKLFSSSLKITFHLNGKHFLFLVWIIPLQIQIPLFLFLYLQM